MYFPYFRGKQFELLALRESATLLAESGFTPIIEPVRESLNGLERTVSALQDAGCRSIVVVNPRHGDHRDDGEGIAALLRSSYQGNDAVAAGLLLRSATSSSRARSLIQSFDDRSEVLIHAGFTEAQVLTAVLGERMNAVVNVFLEDQANMLYRRRFADSTRVLIRDGFEQKRNADYDRVDPFSDLHVTFRDIGMQGYGDFLTVGDHYSEGGGPAYAVAIHLTFIDPDKDDAMFVYHFVSDTNDTPSDPAMKFAQALSKLITSLDGGDSKIYESSAIQEFRRLHERRHFPGLGYVKKLSIKHHLETLADYHRHIDG